MHLLLAVGAGLALRGALGLAPTWWWAWLAPAPLLALALRLPPGRARWLVALAAVVGASANVPFYRLVMPPVATAATVLAQALAWGAVVGTTRRLVLRYRAGWTLLAYPTLWAGLDTLEGALLPDGNWGSLGYSQTQFLPALQVVAVLGVPGLLFVLGLVPAALAVGITYGRRLRRAGLAYGLATLAVGVSLAYGTWRLRTAPPGPATTFGLAAIDVPPGGGAAAQAAVWQQYARHVAALARRGARVVVLPEKIAALAPGPADTLRPWLGRLAARHHLWLAVGVELRGPVVNHNVQWLFEPTGQLAATYQKQYLAPPERAAGQLQVGHALAVRPVAGAAYGLAICKDMHFAALGRSYGQQGVAAMLVPAWDFDLDGRLATGMTATRGVENGYAVVRAARQGLLSVYDAYGRPWGEQASQGPPGSALLVRARLPAPGPTRYTRGGYLFGWLCVAGSTLLLALDAAGRWRRRPG